jgi:uncharacterized membrane protein YecN with MAPEG domain
MEKWDDILFRGLRHTVLIRTMTLRRKVSIHVGRIIRKECRVVQDFVDYIPEFLNILIIREMVCDKLL